MAKKYKPTEVTFRITKPARKSTQLPNPIDGTFADLLVAGVYMPTYFAYRLADDSLDEYSKFVTRIKESLQEILVPFSPFAGRWIANHKGVLQLIDNGEGVPFVETYIDEDIDAVVQTSGGSEPVPELNEISYEAAGLDFSKLKQDMRPEGVPPLLVQVRPDLYTLQLRKLANKF